jgi:hypothetical protein
MQQSRLASLQLIYSRKSSSKQLPWPSNRRKGFNPVEWSNTWRSSIALSMSTRSLPVILPLLEQQQKQGTFFPLNTHSKPIGYILPSPIFFFDFIFLPYPFCNWIKAHIPVILLPLCSEYDGAHYRLTVCWCESQHHKMSILHSCTNLWSAILSTQKSLASNVSILGLRSVVAHFINKHKPVWMNELIVWLASEGILF